MGVPLLHRPRALRHAARCDPRLSNRSGSSAQPLPLCAARARSAVQPQLLLRRVLQRCTRSLRQRGRVLLPEHLHCVWLLGLSLHECGARPRGLPPPLEHEGAPRPHRALATGGALKGPLCVRLVRLPLHAAALGFRLPQTFPVQWTFLCAPGELDGGPALQLARHRPAGLRNPYCRRRGARPDLLAPPALHLWDAATYGVLGIPAAHKVGQRHPSQAHPPGPRHHGLLHAHLHCLGTMDARLHIDRCIRAILGRSSNVHLLGLRADLRDRRPVLVQAGCARRHGRLGDVPSRE
eukprot:scaffold280744_cov31-Tisochrysis_lutea.AAC.1